MSVFRWSYHDEEVGIEVLHGGELKQVVVQDQHTHELHDAVQKPAHQWIHTHKGVRRGGSKGALTRRNVGQR